MPSITFILTIHSVCIQCSVQSYWVSHAFAICHSVHAQICVRYLHCTLACCTKISGTNTYACCGEIYNAIYFFFFTEGPTDLQSVSHQATSSFNSSIFSSVCRYKLDQIASKSGQRRRKRLGCGQANDITLWTAAVIHKVISFTESELKVEVFSFIYQRLNSVHGCQPEIAPFVDGLQHGGTLLYYIQTVSCTTENGGKRVWLDIRLQVFCFIGLTRKCILFYDQKP